MALFRADNTRIIPGSKARVPVFKCATVKRVILGFHVKAMLVTTYVPRIMVSNNITNGMASNYVPHLVHHYCIVCIVGK